MSREPAVCSGALISSVISLMAIIGTIVGCGGSSAAAPGPRSYPGPNWSVLVEDAKGWGVSSQRVRLLRTGTLFPGPSNEDVVVCDWGTVRVYDVQWVDEQHVRIVGWRSAVDGVMMEKWQDVCILYSFSNR
jgi:hypothetical protein